MGCLFELRTDFFRRSELREREHNCPAADLPKSHNVQLQQTELEKVRNWKYLQFGKDISAATIRLSTLKLKQEQNHQSKTDSTFNALKFRWKRLCIPATENADQVQNFKMIPATVSPLHPDADQRWHRTDTVSFLSEPGRYRPHRVRVALSQPTAAQQRRESSEASSGRSRGYPARPD